MGNRHGTENQLEEKKMSKRLLKEYLKLMLESLLDAGEVFTLEAPKTVVHRSTDLELTADRLDPLAIRQTKQSKRGSEPKVGVYAYGVENDVPRYGENKIEITIPAGTKVLDLRGAGRGASSRISLSNAKDLLANGVEAVVGYDYIGPEEWILLKIP